MGAFLCVRAIELMKNDCVVDHQTGTSELLAAKDGCNGQQQQLESGLHSLQRIYLRGLDAVTDDVLLHLCLNSTGGISSLDISGCRNISSRSALILIENCSSTLRELDLSFVRSLTEDAVGLLVDACRNLVTLDIWGCTQLTDRFYEGIERSGEILIRGRKNSSRNNLVICSNL